jgi:hypothetical protein
MDPHTRIWVTAGFIAFALFVIQALARGVMAGYKRRDSLKEWAFRNGMSYFEGPVDAMSIAKIPQAPGDEQWTKRTASNVLTGSRGGYDISLFDLHQERPDGGRVNRHVFDSRTVAVLKVHDELPYFHFSVLANVQPGSFTANLLNVAEQPAVKFDQGEHGTVIDIPDRPGFLVVGRDVERVKSLFKPDMLDYFAHHTGYTIVGEGTSLMIQAAGTGSVADIADIDFFLSNASVIASKFGR